MGDDISRNTVALWVFKMDKTYKNVPVYSTSMYTGGNMLSTRFSSSATARYAANISSSRQNNLKHIPQSMMWEYVIWELSAKTYRKHLPVVTNTHYSLSEINKIICVSIFHIVTITVCYYFPLGRRKFDPKNRGIQSFCISTFDMFYFLRQCWCRGFHFH